MTDPHGNMVKDVDGSPKRIQEWMLQNMRPQVHVNEPPCSHYEPKSYVQIDQEIERDNVETKQ
jgi:hypothetical protein